jgi:hypothetical protein
MNKMLNELYEVVTSVMCKKNGSLIRKFHIPCIHDKIDLFKYTSLNTDPSYLKVASKSVIYVRCTSAEYEHTISFLWLYVLTEANKRIIIIMYHPFHM